MGIMVEFKDIELDKNKEALEYRRKIVSYMKEHGLSSDRMEKLCGISWRQLHRYRKAEMENSDVSIPTADSIVLIKRFFSGKRMETTEEHVNRLERMIRKLYHKVRNLEQA